jgi:hypothetical protein
MRIFLSSCAASVVIGLWATCALGEVTSAQVSAAIEGGVAFLEKQQRPDGRWSEFEIEPGGVTALCALALLRCGRTLDDPSVSKALAYLNGLPDPDRTYNTSLTIMALIEADSNKYFDKISKLASGLQSRQAKKGVNKGGWSYRAQEVGRADNSNTHFALFALHKAQEIGVQVNDQTWWLAHTYWTQKEMQSLSGGYAYGVKLPDPTGSMTCAAITSLLITSNRLQPPEVRIVDGNVECCGAQSNDVALGNAMRWLSDHFSTTRNPEQLGGAWWLYYLWSLEHACELSGQRHIIVTKVGRRVLDVPITHDWYREGCEILLNRQDKLNHTWVGIGAGEGFPEIGTAFTLLFLSHGRRPIVIARLQHQTGATSGAADWNHHHSAARNLTSRLGQQWERKLGWQEINFTRRPKKSGNTIIEAPLLSAADLLEIPVLFLSGSQALDFNSDQRQILKEYLENGGFLLAEACSGNGIRGDAFDRSFRELMHDLFPDHELSKLPPEHAVWHAQQEVDPQRLPMDPEFALWGLDVCCGTSVVYCPRSLSCYWELAGQDATQIQPQQVNDEIEQVMRIGCNVLACATSRAPKERLDRQLIAAKNPRGGPRPGALVVPTLIHESGASEAPTALNHLLRFVEWRLDRPVDYETRLTAAGKLRPLEHPVAFMQGRRAFRFSDTDRLALKEYLDRGGFLFGMSILSSSEFAASWRDELKALYPDANLALISADDPIFTETYSGFGVPTVTLRQLQQRVKGEPLTTKLVEIPPILEGLTIEGRLVAVLSPYDISCALARGGSLEHETYLPVDAAKLGTNVLLYGLQQRTGRLR